MVCKLLGTLHSVVGRFVCLQKHLEVQTEQTDPTDDSNNWISKALKLCAAALQKLEDVRIDEGWKLLYDAQRMEVYSGANFQKATITQLREEASKLHCLAK